MGCNACLAFTHIPLASLRIVHTINGRWFVAWEREFMYHFWYRKTKHKTGRSLDLCSVTVFWCVGGKGIS